VFIYVAWVMVYLCNISRVQKNPGFFKKAQCTVFWFYCVLGFTGFSDFLFE